MIGEGVRDFAYRLVQLILGIDELYRESSSPDVQGLAREGWVAINLSEATPRSVASYSEGRVGAETLRSELAQLDLTEGRRRYYADYLIAIDTFCRWREKDDLPFEHLVSGLLGVPGEPPDLEPILTDLDRELRAAGYLGDTVSMINRFREDRAVRPEDALETLAGYLAVGRSWVNENLFLVPGRFDFRVEGERGLPYDAYCEYTGRFVRINLDIQFTHEELKHLATHEAYPGHSTHILRREMLVDSGDMTEDGLLVVTDTPTNTLFEGIGELGLRLVGWDRTDAERINLLLIRLLAAVSARAGYLFARNCREEAMELLERYGDAAWAQSRCGLLDLPLRRPFIYTYFYGDELVRQARDRASDTRVFLTHLYDRMHSPASLLVME